MKKITLLAVAVLAISFASCKKDRTCTCISTSDQPGYVSSTTVSTVKKSKKTTDIKANCVSYSSKQTAPVAGTYSYGKDCTLK